MDITLPKIVAPSNSNLVLFGKIVKFLLSNYYVFKVYSIYGKIYESPFSRLPFITIGQVVVDNYLNYSV